MANNCEVVKLHNRLQDLEVSAGINSSNSQQSSSTNLVKTQEKKSNSNDEVVLVEIFEASVAEIKKRPLEDWIVDSSASAHVTGNLDLLSNIDKGPNSSVTTTGGNTLSITSQRTTNILKNKAIDHVYYVPSMIKNLISIGKLANSSYYTLFGSQNCWIFLARIPTK